MADKYISQLPLATSVLASDHIITDNGTNTTRTRVGSLSSVFALKTQTALAQSVSTADIQDYLLMSGNSPGLSGVELKITLSDLTTLLENLIDSNSLWKDVMVYENGSIFTETATDNKSFYYVLEFVTDFYTLFNGHSAHFTCYFNPTSYGDNYVAVDTAPALSASHTTLAVGDYMTIKDIATDDHFTFYFQTTGSGGFTCGKPGTGGGRIPSSPTVCPPLHVKKVVDFFRDIAEGLAYGTWNTIANEINKFTTYNTTTESNLRTTFFEILDVLRTQGSDPREILDLAQALSRLAQSLFQDATGASLPGSDRELVEEKVGESATSNFINLATQLGTSFVINSTSDFEVDPPADTTTPVDPPAPEEV